MDGDNLLRGSGNVITSRDPPLSISSRLFRLEAPTDGNDPRFMFLLELDEFEDDDEELLLLLELEENEKFKGEFDLVDDELARFLAVFVIGGNIPGAATGSIGEFISTGTVGWTTGAAMTSGTT